jgi:gamma-D-glutamyl-L-lysine dipeptidyl-peptidase
MWDEPANEKSYWHRVTQLLLGERVLVLAEQGEWSQIVAVEQASSLDPLGYPGWVRNASLAPGWTDAENGVPEFWAVVMRRYAYLRNEPSPAAEIVQRLHLDVRLPVIQPGDAWVEVALPGGGSGWLQLKDIRLAADPNLPVPLDQVWNLLAELEGLPYLWGGTTGHSLDCSGLLYRVFHAHGWQLARDAHDQAAQMEPVQSGAWQPGDFLFYSRDGRDPVTHVGLYAGDGQVIDANPYLGVSKHPTSEMVSWYAWYGVRRFQP